MPVTPAQLARQRRHAQKGGAIGFPVFNPPAGLWIGGADYSRYLVQFSATVRSTISPYAGIFRCQLDGPAATLQAVKVEQELTYNRDGVQYAGRVRSVIPEDQIIASANRTLTIECQDFTTLLDRDICAYAVSAPQVSPARLVVESDVQRIGWLLQSFGRQSVTLHHVMQNYATVPATDYTGMTLRKAIEDVLAYSGASYYVDYAKDLHAYLDEKQYAPFTLSETPNDVSSFGYSELTLPTDSIDMRNAVFVIPGAPTSPVTATELPTTGGGEAVATASACIVSFLPAAGARVVQVGVAGPVLQVSGASVTPQFGQPTTAGCTLVAFLRITNQNDPTANIAGWQRAAVADQSYGARTAVMYKLNCAANESAPTFTEAGATLLIAQLAEFSGVGSISQTGHATRTAAVAGPAVAVSQSAADQGAGALLCLVVGYNIGISDTITKIATTFSNSAQYVHLGDTGATNQVVHFSAGYAISVGPTWYSDEASVALYGRAEASLTTSTPVTTQGDLDTLAAAYLFENSAPQQQGSVKCRKPGLVVGQRLTVQSSLYTVPVVVDPLGNYTGLVQAVEFSYSTDGLTDFVVEFLKPTSTLAPQIRSIVNSISSGTTIAAAAPAGAVYAVIYQSTPQSIVSNAWTAVTNMLVAFQSQAGVASSGTGPFTVPANIANGVGTFEVSVSAAFTAGGAAGTRIGGRVVINGGSSRAVVAIATPVTAGVQTAEASNSGMVSLSAGDQLTMEVYQDSGGALNTDAAGQGDPYRVRFTVRQVV